MLQKKTAKQVIVELIDSLKTSLNELTETCGSSETEFICGEKYAYVECLEIIQTWSEAEKYGLVGNLEELFGVN